MKRLLGRLSWLIAPAAAYVLGLMLNDPGPQMHLIFRPVGSWRSFGAYPLLAPTDVAPGPNGSMVISDRHSNRIFLVGLDGRLIATAGGVGTAPGQLRSPAGVDSDRQGQIFVADSDNHRVQVFDQRLRYLRTVYPDLLEPKGIAVDGHGGFWLSAGEFTGSPYPPVHFDDNGHPDLHASLPLAGLLTHDSAGHLWAANRTGSYDPILEFGNGGRLMQRLGRGDLHLAEKVAVAGGVTVVADRSRPGLVAFDDRGIPIGATRAADLPQREGYPIGPYGVATDAQGDIWACFLDASVVVRFRLVRAR